MDPRLESLLTRQQRLRFAGLAGSEADATIRLTGGLVNEVIAAHLPRDGPLRSVTVRSYAGNRLDISLALTKLAFLPAIPLTVAIEEQPHLPADATLTFRVSGGIGNLMKLAGPALGVDGRLPAGVRLEGDRLRVDVRTLLEQRGQAAVLEFVRDLRVTTEDRRLVVRLKAVV
jgi:hypothetical protein